MFGILFSCTVIYFLLDKIRLAKCQNLLIINVAVSDIFASTVGFFRGLGIIDPRFVGSPGKETTVRCAIYAFALNTLATSGIVSLLPLTLDRAVAVLFPLHHSSVITKKTCLIMFVIVWTGIVGVFIYDSVIHTMGSIPVEYYHKYHRCVVLGPGVFYTQIFYLFIPLILIIILYISMFTVIIRNKSKCGRFLITATGIIMTSILAFSPSVITNLWNVPLSYEVSQILTVTVYYLGGIVNPIIYFVAHPVTRRWVKTKWVEKIGSSVDLRPSLITSAQCGTRDKLNLSKVASLESEM